MILLFLFMIIKQVLLLADKGTHFFGHLQVLFLPKVTFLVVI
jgi:hypothetical protein